MGRVLLRSILLLTVLAFAHTVSADTVAVAGLNGEQLTALAAELLARNRLDDAAVILDRLETEGAGGTEREYLQGVLAARQGRFHIAADRFRVVLGREPELTEARLELARAQYMIGDYTKAGRQLRLAQAGTPPAAVKESIRRLQQLIRQQRPWQFDIGFSLTPDTNINGATRHDRVNIYGLPFALDDSSRASSGIGLAIDLQGSYRFRQEEAVPVYLGARGFLQQYNETMFNDDSLDIEAGPEFTTSLGRLRTSATYLWRWYGGSPYQEGPGLRLSLDAPAYHSWWFGLRFDARELNHPGRDYLNGWEYGTFVRFAHFFRPGIHASAWLGLRYQDAADKVYVNRGVRLGVALSKELPWELRGSIGVEAGRTIYADEIPAFGIRRKDHFFSYSATLAKSGWNIAGFVPVFRLVKYERDSTLVLYETGKWRGEIGLTRSF